MAGPNLVGKEVGDANLTFLAGRLDDLNLVSLGWYRGCVDNMPTSYPAVPYLQCPRLLQRATTFTISPGPPRAGQVHKVTFNYSMVFQRLQVPGEAHQELLLADIQAVISMYTQAALQPQDIAGVNGFKLTSAFPSTLIIHPELRHKFDDPKLRISVAELALTVTGEITTCA